MSSNIEKMVNDICCSIPYILGEVNERGVTPPNSQGVKAFAGYTSIWALRITPMVKILSTDRKRFILQQLEYIEGTMGIKQARTVAGLSWKY
jgi:hypothetical protein